MLSMPWGSPTLKTTFLPLSPPLVSSWLSADTAIRTARRSAQGTMTRASRFMTADSLTASHEIPVKEPLEPPVEVELRADTQEAVRLGRVGHVLERLAELAQALDELLGLLRAHALVALPVCDQQRHLDVLELVVRRADDVRLARLGGRAHHALEVLHAGAVALRPRGRDVAVAVLRHRTPEAVLGV